MLDEKKIEEKALEEFPLNSMQRYAYKKGYQDAIQEFLKGLWHPASEEPKENKPYIYDSPHNSKSYYYVEDDVAKVLEIYHRWNRYVRIYKIHHWCYLDDILPKQKGGE